MKRSNVNLQSCVVALMAMTALMACGTPRQSVVPATSKDQLEVPKVNLDKDGFFTVDDCPTTHDVLDVTLNEGEYAINLVLVSSDDLPMTTVPLDEDYGVTQDVVHFLDANFDGKVDILVGPGSNRNYSVLLLWNDEKNDFVLASNDGFVVFNGFFFFDTKNEVVYRVTSGSAFETTCTKMMWMGTDLQSEVTFLQVFDPSYYDSYRVTNRYTIRNYYSDEDVISTDDPNDISLPWSEWLVEDE